MIKVISHPTLVRQRENATILFKTHGTSKKKFMGCKDVGSKMDTNVRPHDLIKFT